MFGLEMVVTAIQVKQSFNKIGFGHDWELEFTARISIYWGQINVGADVEH